MGSNLISVPPTLNPGQAFCLSPGIGSQPVKRQAEHTGKLAIPFDRQDAYPAEDLPPIEKESTMHGHFVLSVLLSLACVATTCAAGPQDDPAPAPPGLNLVGPALINNEALTNSDSAITAQPSIAKPRYVGYRGFETQHRSDDCNCCAEYFGGFGPLWETYCADKHRCWGAAAACGPSSCYPRCGLGCRIGCAPPLFSGYYRKAFRARCHRFDCCVGPSCDYDCGAPAMSEPLEMTPQEAAEPAEPTPAQPEQSVEPAPAPPPAPPDATPAMNTSSRRSWLQKKRLGALPR